MFANRISYWLDAKGPSMSLDAMCASSMVALKHAIEAIRSGECDSAIVGSANICLHPQSSILYGRTIKMSEDGVVRAFDKDANGTVRSEAINVLFLQKAKDAKRVYAELCHAECDFIPETNDYGHLRSVSLMRNFFTEFYQKANVSPNEVGYIEAFGTGVPEADKNELEAISEVFCKDRTDPLLVGSVMSNMGYSEAASGISSIVKVIKMCPPEIEVACHNSSESCTISGPSDAMKNFVDKLTAQGVFAKEVPCSNIAYYSRYIAQAGPKLREYLSKVIKNPKERSDRWVSTSVPQDQWNLDSAKYSSAEYHTNNLLSPVLFEETSRLIPQNAVTIEVAPHGLLQAILKRSLNPNCINVPLTRRGHSDPVTFILNALGETMAPLPKLDAEEVSLGPGRASIDDDSIVISGMAGLFPMSKNVKSFSDNLYNKVYMVTDKVRFSHNHPELQNYCGVVPDMAPFDAQFFGMHAKLCLATDSMSRKLMEQAYQVIYDAGLHVDEVRNTKLGVFFASCFSETEKAICYIPDNKNGFAIMGCNRAMYANRVSYWLNAKGPSMSIDAMCSSSIVALKHAVEAIRSGTCESALVGSANICLHPHSSILYGRTIKLCEDGKVRSFCKDADGTVRSESVNILFLQKAKHAKRIYAEVCHVECNFMEDRKATYGPLRSVPHLRNFYKEFYEKAKVSPNEVQYVEAFGTAIPEADKNELQAIGDVFCENRTEPLLVGSVMSNIGYTEAASGICSIVKVCLAYHTGKVAANLHCDDIRDDVDALRDGRMRVVTGHAPADKSYCAINSFSVGGLNGHVLLRGYANDKRYKKYHSNIPYLVTISGRNEAAVAAISTELQSHPVDPEELSLLHNIHERSTLYHMARGYCILSTNENEQTSVLANKCDYFDDTKRPLWFVYSGMGSQWATMGTELMRIPIFAAAIERCRKVLEPKGVDILDILTNPDKKTFDNILNSFVGIAAVQIGLTDILTELGIVPDKIIGHSVGELGCAYADGCFTAEEMILAAYCRGLVSVETPFIHGSMAAVGLGYSTIIKMCPPEIEVACHNSSESCTISGPSDAMKKFVDKLTAQGVFAKEVPCSNIAYHSRYIAQAGPKLLEYLAKVIKDPKERSARWVSTSVPQDKWNQESAKYSSAEYHTNNLLNPVLFEETAKLIPANAITIEIAPHGLLQAILKRSLGQSCINIPLTRRAHRGPVTHFLNSLGQMYMAGIKPKLQALYPKVQYPVSTGTKFLSHLTKWAHTETWYLPTYAGVNKLVAAQRNFVMSTHDDEFKYIEGHVIEGNIVFPLSALLVMVWETFAMVQRVDANDMSIRFDNVNSSKDAVVHRDQVLHLTVTIQKGSQRFEVTSDNNVLIEGSITRLKKTPTHCDELSVAPADSYELDSTDIYKMFFRRGYYYRDEFRSVRRANFNLTKAKLSWTNDWVTFIDSIFQMNILRRAHDGVTKLKYIKKLIIDISKHNIFTDNSNIAIDAETKPLYNVSRCGGLFVEGIEYADCPPCSANNVLKERNLMHNCHETLDNKSDVYFPIKTSNEATDVILTNSDTKIQTLFWKDVRSSPIQGIPVKVHYAGVNHNDAMKVIGQTPVEADTLASYGMDYSGITQSGQRVMGVVRNGAIATKLEADPDLLWPVPDHWTMEDAATVPLPYLHAFYCLMSMRPNAKILIHGGTGALGQAVISVALSMGCDVFATVSSVHKKRFLLKTFPQMKEANIGNSRDDSFLPVVLRKAGYGMDHDGCAMIVSNLKGYLREVSTKCVGFGGHFVDVSSHDMMKNSSFGFNYLCEERNYKSSNISKIFERNNTEEKQLLQRMLSEGIASGSVRPITRVTYAPADVTRAFRLLATSGHRGRVLLRMREISALTPTPSLSCPSDKSYLVMCGKEGFGIDVADRLVQRGVRHLAVHLDPDLDTGLLLGYLNSWKENGVTVVTHVKPLDSHEYLNMILKKCEEMGPIEGILVTDGYKKSILEALDKSTRNMHPQLKYLAILKMNTNKVESHEEEIIKYRNESRLPALLMTFPHLYKFDNLESNIVKSIDDDAIPQTTHQALSALEDALAYGSSRLVTTYAINNTVQDILSNISTISGVNITDKLTANTKLGQLGIDMDASQSICNYLEKIMNISINKDEIPDLTIAMLRNMQTRFNNEEQNVTTYTNDLSIFFTRVDPEEIDSSVDIITMPTLALNKTQRSEDFDSKETYLVIIPGLEGHYAMFHRLCERLKIPAVVLQPSLENYNESVEEVAHRFVKLMKVNMELDGKKFYILGFSVGVSVALEMSAILEEQGYEGTVFCLDSAPDVLPLQLAEVIGDKSDAELQDAIVEHMYSLMAQEDGRDLNADLRSNPSWEGKVDVGLRHLRGRVSNSTQYARLMIEAAYGRICAARKYNSKRLLSRPLKSQIILMRGQMSGVPKDYGLSRYALREPVVYQLDTDLRSTPQDLRCSNIVNKHLGADVLEEFSKRNLCDIYEFLSRSGF